jgi:hypothetical protein
MEDGAVLGAGKGLRADKGNDRESVDENAYHY